MDMEVWVATDNDTANKAYFKGRSSSPKLDKMVLELKVISMNANCVLHLVHTAHK